MVDGGKDEIVIASLSLHTICPISALVTPPSAATEDNMVSGPYKEDPVLELKLESTLEAALRDASEPGSNSELPIVESPVVEVPDDVTTDPEQSLEPLPASFVVVAIPVSDVQSIHDQVASFFQLEQDLPPMASPVIATTTTIDVEVFIDESALIPEPEPESLPASSPVLVTPAADYEVIPDTTPVLEQESEPSLIDIATPIIEQELEHSPINVATPVTDVGTILSDVPVILTLEPEFVSLIIAVVPTVDVQRNPVETAPLSFEDALQQELFQACPDEEVLTAPEPSLAKYNIVPDDATSLKDALESKQQEIPESLTVIDGLSRDLPIGPSPSTTGNSMTELAPCHPPLPDPCLPLLLPCSQTLGASSLEHKSDSTHLPRIRRRVRRSVKRERKAEREAAEAAAAVTTMAQARTSTSTPQLTHYHHDTPDWCLVVRGRGHGRR